MERSKILTKNMKLEHAVDVQAKPDKIWNFLLNIEQNYKTWHPEDHIIFQWTKGKPLETGSQFYAEQYMMGNKVKYRGKITESVPKEKITMKFNFPMCLITRKIDMIIETKDDYSQFRHIAFMRFLFLSRTVFRKRNLAMLRDMNEHVAREGENMKNILETQE